MIWNALLAACTFALAVVTAVMAWFTRMAIIESHAQYEKTRIQSEQHQQDSFRPIVVLDPFVGIEQSDRANVVSVDASSHRGDMRLFRVACLVQNVGVGPALNVHLTFRAMGRVGYGFTKELTPLPADEKRGDTRHAMEFWVQPTRDFNDADIRDASRGSWELVLEYEDVFGNPFHTIHRKNPQMPWTECGKGPAPGITHQGVTPSE